MTDSAHLVLKALEHDLIRDEFRPAGLFIPEVQAPGSDRRADLIWMTARTAHISGYEIKVTRADLLNELRDPTKCEPWLKYCDRWWLAVGDPSILDGLMDRIPDDWGICTPPTSASRRMMTVIKEAPVLAPADKGPVLGKLISHQAYRQVESNRRVAQAEQRAEYERKNREAKDDWRVQQIRERANPHEELFRKVGDEFKKLKNERGSWTRLDSIPPETIARAILNADEMDRLARDAAEAVKDQLRRMDRAVNDIADSYTWKNMQETLKGMLNDD